MQEPIASSADVLQRRLGPRHIYMMSIGSAIGVGLFLGSGDAISIAGPAVLLAYALVGVIVFWLMRALGKWPCTTP
jgi:AAT family amino acid transporter